MKYLFIQKKTMERLEKKIPSSTGLNYRIGNIGIFNHHPEWDERIKWNSKLRKIFRKMLA